MLTIAHHANQRNHIQAIFSVWQCPSSLFFWPIRTMILQAFRVLTAADSETQAISSTERHYRTMGVIRDVCRMVAETAGALRGEQRLCEKPVRSYGRSSHRRTLLGRVKDTVVLPFHHRNAQ